MMYVLCAEGQLMGPQRKDRPSEQSILLAALTIDAKMNG
jgi:hypothetical protein